MALFGPSTDHLVQLDGALVVVTGGARGIGAATARLFAQHGARVVLGDVDLDVAEATAATLPGARAARLDVTDRDSWAALIADLDAPIDVLVNNAGVMPLGHFEEESETTTDLILDVNVRGMLNGMRAVIPGMAEAGRGHVVNVASMAGMIPIPGMVTYNASKFAALGASLAARREYEVAGVAVCAILPSAVRTELSSGAQLGGGMPTVDPEDVAAAIVDTLRTRAARTSVPKWVAPGWSLVEAFVPEPIERLARKLVDDRRTLALDAAARKAYTDRIARQATDHAALADDEATR
ncbi:SDR family oxidoreductase [Tsukamurella tyrosinosolvens]|uniref:SDR family oxidoreductase n=1 Tax=Tsukamurella tyrosinosolvens TaxID=57704 RepID=UPI0007923EF8|nr:SDR family oxidoreductase [Tsukamurella tyrosinosolvens]KXP01187.1 short-chain dehydrogenase [Tsukamurella tyrosinosolvens]KZL94590.1 short-chain dehydrogenase [Tsukamurella tyrosinosolvens]MCA4997365.1 SDR family oxidoreductase [Tsukamurella tyrosinosolvens]WEL93415.1 SDR family oxidoreductase [Tsukamurella tyrosinosolvens]